MKKYIFTLFIFPLLVKAQISPESLSFAGANMFQNTVAVIYDNVSRLPLVNTNQIAFSAQNQFLIPELNTFTFASNYKYKNTFLASGIQYNGNKNLNISSINFSCAKLLTQDFSIGAAINAVHFNSIDPFYNQKTILSLHLSSTYNLTKQMTASMAFNHFNTPKLSESIITYKMPFKFSAALLYQFDNKMSFGFEIQKHQTFVSKFAFAKYKKDHIHFNFGIGADQLSAKIGSGIHYFIKNHQFIIGINYHQILNTSTALGYVYSF